jgi:hypothetical protein
MMGVYLYAGISKETGEVISGLTEQDANAIPAERVAFRVTRGGLVDVHLNPASAAGEDVARQMITTMSTLVVAIASFYFGTSSVQQAFTTGSGDGGGGGSPKLARVEPKNTPRVLRRRDDGGWEPETIRLRSVPPDARVEGSVEGDVASSLAAVDDSGAYTYAPVRPSPDGVTVSFLLAAHREVAAEKLSYLVPGGEGGAPPPPEGPPDGAQQPPAEQLAVAQPAVAQPVVEQPAVEQPAVEQPAVEQPAVERLEEGPPAGG